MQFRLETLLPLPMRELDTSGSDIWEKEEYIFEKGKKYLVGAASGKGKTSLLSLLYGLRKDYSGRFFIDDKPGDTISPREWSWLRKNDISYIFQGLDLFDELTAMENIQLKNRMTRHKSAEEIIRMAETLDIAPFLQKKCGHLSYGQRQRVAIVRALCQPFKYLFADECFSHIDRENRENALELIHAECKKNEAGMILTSLDHQAAGTDIQLKL